MKKETIYTKSGKVKEMVLTAIRDSRINGLKIYPVSWKYSCGHANKRDLSCYIIMTLKWKGYKYTIGNDAPKGGQQGNYLQISRVAMNYLKSLS